MRSRPDTCDPAVLEDFAYLQSVRKRCTADSQLLDRSSDRRAGADP